MADVPAALDAAYGPILAFFEQAHRQEHRFRRQEYGHLAHRFDALVHCAREWRRAVLDRAERLGAPLASEIPAGAVTVESGVLDAYRATAASLGVIYDAVGLAIGAAQAAGDHPTLKALFRIQAHVDRKRAKVEAWIDQVTDIGPAYLLSAI